MSPPRDLTRIASVMVFTSACLWGLAWWPLHYFVDQGIPGAWAVVGLGGFAAAALFLFVCYDARAQLPHLRRALPIGIVTGAAFTCYYAGLIHTSVIRATLFFYLTPIWGTLLGIYWLREQADWRRWAAIGVGLIGLICLLSGDHAQPLNAGDALALASGVLWAIGGVMIMARPGIPVAGITMLQFLFLAVFSLAVGGLLNDLALPDPALLARTAPALAGFAIVLYVPAVVLLFWASRILFPGRVGILMMSEVYVAILSASLLLPDERMAAIQWLGAALIIAAGLIEVLPTGPRKPRAA